MSTNDETGETENSVHLTLNDFDLETGESNSPNVVPNMNIFWRQRKTTTFHVPKSCLEEFSEKKKEKKKSCFSISNKRTYYVANKREVINLKEVKMYKLPLIVINCKKNFRK